MSKKKKPLITAGQDWSFEMLEIVEKEIAKIAKEELRLNVYPNQIEIITAEAMLDAYASVGMPIYYNHWSFGKDFISNHRRYESGNMGLAYEIVINSNPCISYCMDSNTAMMQALVIAHAGYGHNAVFKNNYLFKQWTDASSIIDYMNFAKKFIKSCEERYGFDEVESVLDSCHALAYLGVDKVKRPHTPTLRAEDEEKRAYEAFDEKIRNYNELWDKTVPKKPKADKVKSNITQPEDNVLYFIEKNAPTLPGWKREIIRIVRKINQYFFPQSQTKVVNEGFATFTHYYIMTRLYEKGIMDSGAYQEFLHSHTAVVAQPGYDSPYFSGFNPYALGFAMFKDIKRICEEPTDEDRMWFPDLIGKDWVDAVQDAMMNYNDSSFVAQFLSPHLMRHFKMFAFSDQEDDDFYSISAIHNDDGYYRVRKILSDNYMRSVYVPDIQVVDVDIYNTRALTLRHNLTQMPLKSDQAERTGLHVVNLWEQPVILESVDSEGEHDFKIHFKGKFEQ